ncbi:hypothetical protein JHN59_11475 [Streptomyces sp. MBT49]|uniref:hypothetical protein n=1 Tax=unclassified Streptomyces TaxID=2593676 RepID=UPI00190B512B|nr:MULTISPECIES: hypothetical protein [unclassified Streptomyces]MBK3625455.1 hypothetical protein [Streptomyces sp. MBT49]MBK3633282.1 hypothetical protein [Streptomyces sp. MBT97]
MEFARTAVLLALVVCVGLLIASVTVGRTVPARPSALARRIVARRAAKGGGR